MDVAATLQALTPATTLSNTATTMLLTDISILSTPTLLPPTQVPEPPGAILITFLSGATSSNVDGILSLVQVQYYLVRALRRQPWN